MLKRMIIGLTLFFSVAASAENVRYLHNRWFHIDTSCGESVYRCHIIKKDGRLVGKCSGIIGEDTKIEAEGKTNGLKSRMRIFGENAVKVTIPPPNYEEKILQKTPFEAVGWLEEEKNRAWFVVDQLNIKKYTNLFFLDVLFPSCWYQNRKRHYLPLTVFNAGKKRIYHSSSYTSKHACMRALEQSKRSHKNYCSYWEYDHAHSKIVKSCYRDNKYQLRLWCSEDEVESSR